MRAVPTTKRHARLHLLVMRKLPDTNHPLPGSVSKNIPWFRQRVRRWWKQNGRSFPWRERSRTAYEVLIAEVLLQRTTAGQVTRFYDTFLSCYPDWSALRKARARSLKRLLKPLGLSGQKAKVLRSLANAMKSRADRLPHSRLELEKLPGVGQYIASAVLVTFYGKAEPLLDVNMARVLERFFGPRSKADLRDDGYLQTLARKAVRGPYSLRSSWMILDFAAAVCKASRPSCPLCPLNAHCLYYSSSRGKPAR